MSENTTTLKGISDCLIGGKAPAQIGKPVFASDIEKCKWLGAEKPSQIFGLKVMDSDERTPSIPLNFKSKESTGQLPEETRIRLFALKKALSNCQIQAQIMGRCINPSASVMMATPVYKNSLGAMLKAFNITDFADWVDTVQSRFFFEEYEIPLLLADKFDYMPMTSPLVRVPGALDLLYGQLETDDATFTAQSNTESSYIVESKNNVVHTLITQDLLDDSSPAIIDKLRREVLKGVARSHERSILDGDTSVTHQDQDVTAAKDYRKAWNGLRKRAFDNEAAIVGGGGAANQIVYDHGDDVPSKDLFSELLKRLKCLGDDKQDLCYIMGCSTSHDLVAGAIPELFTAFSFGSLASNRTGQVPPVFGIESVESSYVREDLASTGKFATATTDTQTYMILVKKSRFSNWIRQATRVWASPSLPSSDSMLMSGKQRAAFAGIPQSTTERSVVMGINIKTV